MVEKKKMTVKKTTVKKPVTKKKVSQKITPKEALSKKTVVTSDAEKQAIINKFSTHPGDTGSPEVQVAILTWKIVNLQKHLQTNQKDNHSRRGLLKIVSKRRRIMKYLRDKDEQRFNSLEGKIKEYQADNK